LKNLGALSEYAEKSQISTKSKNFKILILYLGYNDVVKKTISRYCPFKKSFSFPEKLENGLVDERVSSPVPEETNVSEVHLPGKQRRL
jgi:hypothetical protein